jgi:hypothetical protein
MSKPKPNPKRIMAWAVAGACALAASAAADDATAKAHQHPAGGTITATGCLEKGDVANTYKLTHATVTDWQIVDAPADLKLAEHVGHKVELTGTALAPGDKTADEKGISSGTGSGARTPVEKNPGDDQKGISSGTGSGAAKMKDKDHKAGRLKVTSLKHIAATCP